MKCPYNCKSETHYQRWVQEYDEDLRAPKACSQIDQRTAALGKMAGAAMHPFL